MGLGHISFCGPLRHGVTTATAVRGRFSQLNCRNTHSRACLAQHDSDCSSLTFTILILLSSCLPLALCGCLGGQLIGATAAAANGGTLQATPNSVNFGGVATGTMASTNVYVVNRGSAAVNVSQINVSGQAFTVDNAGNLPITVAAGGTYGISVNFVPTGMGAAAGQLTIGSNAATDGALVVGLSGTGTAASATTSPELTSLSCTFSSVTGSAIDNCTVALDSAAANGGFAVSLSSDDSAVAVPASVTVAAGSTTASFTATISPVSSAQTATLAASASDVAETFTLQLNANALSQGSTGNPVLNGLSCAFGSMTGGGNDGCAVTLSAAAPGGGFVVNLASDNAAVVLPANVTVVPGSTSASFTATVSPVSSVQTATLTAGAGNVAETFFLQLNASAIGQGTTGIPVLSGLNCTIESIAGAGTVGCTVTLNAPAPNGGFVVNLASSNPAVTLPATVTVAAESTIASFTANVSPVSSAQMVTLTASAGSTAETFTLQLNVDGAAGLTADATSIAFGIVPVNTTVTQSVELTSSSVLPITIVGATVQGVGFSITGTTFPLTLAVGQPATVEVTFDPTAAAATTGQLTILSAPITNGATVINLSGTGVATAYQVNLSWDAPSSSADPVAGYLVYRSPSGAASFQQLSGVALDQTTYVDTNVQNGQSYDYIVESVDAVGVTSEPSNTATVAIP
jgi:ASPM-SPD-2-Hydin domain-containing protein/centrosomal CEP192-like protein